MTRNTASFFLFGGAALLALAACTTSDTPSGKGAAITTEKVSCVPHPTSVFCDEEVVANVSVSNDETDLVIRVDGEGDYLIYAEHIHAGLDFPPTDGGDFDLNAFPFQFDHSGMPLEQIEHRIPLASVGASCGDTLSMAVHVVMVRVDTSGAVIDRKEGYAFADHAFGSGYCFYYDVCCPTPEHDAGVPEHDAGAPEHDAGVPHEDAGPPDEEGCTLTQGFWKNHPEDWPVDSLTIAGVTYTQAELLVLLNTPVRGDASISLVHQLIAAMLNVEAGATAPSAIAEAQAFLSANADADGRLPFGFSGGTDEHREASRLNDLLTAFNEGRAGALHCDEDGDDRDEDDRDRHHHRDHEHDD